MKLVTAEQMRKIDAATIDKYGIPGILLMENAGVQVANAVRELIQEKPGARVVVVCGKGNNGGDGLVAARHLTNDGTNVRVALLCNGADMAGDAATNFRIARNMGVSITENADLEAVRAMLGRADIVVDAILGTGISGEVHGLPRAAIEAVNDSGASVVSADIPSGINADTGQVSGVAVIADVTVTFGAIKLGLVQHPGASFCGNLRLVEIGIPRSLTFSTTISANLVTEPIASFLLPMRDQDIHKGDAGRLLVLAGSVGMTGAAALCAQAAMRTGAGLVTLGCPESLNDVLEEKCTETMTVPLPETPARSLSTGATARVLELAERSDAVALGPGLSQNPDTFALVRELVPAIAVPLVLDADGLNALEGSPQAIASRTAPTVITPHPGELARLMGSTIEAVQENRVEAARRAARETQAVVLLKGAASVIAQPSGEVWINTTGNPGMASGGMGDVLTGMVGALLAADAGPESAAIAGAYYHGLAGDAAAKDGERGLIASDVLRTIQDVLPD